jgi:flagellar FliJ protein
MTGPRRHHEDKALGAVERVRTVRERDSRVGLQQALVTNREHEVTVEASRLMMEEHPAFSHGSIRDFHADRALVMAMAMQHQREREQAAASRTVAEEAQRRWQHDRTRVRAVELLLERRAEERRVEQQRREAHELDDLAAQSWLRGHHVQNRRNT